MTKDAFPTLSNPPIVEAIIEFRFKPAASSTLEQLKAFAEHYQATYPTSKPVYEQVVEFALHKEGENQASAVAHPHGFRLENVTGNRVIVGSIDRLVVSIHTPYAPWPALEELALEAYQTYSGFLPEQTLIRVGMRYINHLHVVVNKELEFEHYLKTMPRLPQYDGIPESLAHFNTAVTIPFTEENCLATVRQAFIQSTAEAAAEKPGTITLIFDSDVFRSLDAPLGRDALSALLGIMHDIKNRLFFGSLTVAALEAYR